MNWKVRDGQVVDHDGKRYIGGDLIPCNDEQAALMPHAVERVVVTQPVETKKRTK